MTGIDWERRRRNVRVLMALANTNPTKVAEMSGLSPNTLSKFTSGKTKTLSVKSLGLLVQALGLASAEDLDTDNPVDNPKLEIKKIVDSLPEEMLPSLLKELEVRFSQHLEK